MENYKGPASYRGYPALPFRKSRVFLILWILSLAAFRIPLAALAALAWRDERYSYILAVPFITAFLICLRKNRVARDARYGPQFGIPLLLAGILFTVIAGLPAFPADDALSATIFGLLMIWAALGVFCFGIGVLNATVSPLLFLLLLIPVPASVMDMAAVGLQKGSAEITAVLFRMVGLPFSRNGFLFSLPGVQIEIAEQCSGIRSTVSLFICGILAGHLFLRRGWTRVAFALLTIPVVIFKNAVRIATISWLGVSVDRSFFTGNLHRHGGLPFSLLAIAVLLPVLSVLKNAERRSERAGKTRAALRPAHESAPSL
jgi:exosortase